MIKMRKKKKKRWQRQVPPCKDLATKPRCGMEAIEDESRPEAWGGHSTDGRPLPRRKQIAVGDVVTIDDPEVPTLGSRRQHAFRVEAVRGKVARTTAHPDTEAQETEGLPEDKPEDERGEEPEEEPEDEQEILPSPSRQPLRRSKRKRNEARSADESKRARIAALLVTQWRRGSCCSYSEE